VVGHQAPVQDADGDALVGQEQDLFEGQIVAVLLEQPQAAVGAVEHVIDDSAGGFTGESGHAERIPDACPKKKARVTFSSARATGAPPAVPKPSLPLHRPRDTARTSA